MSTTYFIEALAMLQQAGISNPHREARLLLAYLLNLPPDPSLQEAGLADVPPGVLAAAQLEIFLHGPPPLGQAKKSQFMQWVKRRAQQEPLSKIIGQKEFWREVFITTKDTLDPRADSETLIEAVLEIFPERGAPYQILDLGTGSGCLLASLLREYPAARGIGVDLSPRALAVAALNLQRLGLQSRAGLVCSNWTTALNAKFDIIISNPPYVATNDKLDLSTRLYDPPLALFAGTDGLNSYKTILPLLHSISAPHSRIFLEVGWQQQAAVQKIIEDAGGQFLSSKSDGAQYPRVAIFACLE